MAEMSDYLEEKLINHSLKGVSYTPPSSIWLALYSTNPTDEDIGVECTGASYSRKQVTFGDVINGTVSNSAEIEFNNATTDWGIISHVGLRDAESGGNLLYFTALFTSREVAQGDIFKVQVDNLSVSLS